MNERLVRYADLLPLFATPPRLAEGRGVNVLAGVMGDAWSSAASAEACPVTIHALRHAGGQILAPYTHAGAEVFVAHTGHWQVRFGANGEDGARDLAPGDAVSVCPGVFRCIDKPAGGVGCLLILSGSAETLPKPEPNTVFSPVFGPTGPPRQPRRWIDTSSGTPVLKDVGSAEFQLPWTAAPAGRQCSSYVAAAEATSNAASPLAREGVEEAGVFVPCATRDRFQAGPSGCGWPHGFNLRRVTLHSSAYVPLHTRGECELLFVQEGCVEVQWQEGAIMMGAGDTLNIPAGVARALRNTTSGTTRIFVIRGSDDPCMPAFLSMPPHGETSST